MKRTGFILSLALFFGLLPLAAPADTITLRIATWGSPTHPQVQDWVPVFTHEVEQNSHGQIKVNYFPAASLVKEQDVASAVPSDVADISLVVIEEFAGLDQTLAIFGSPLLQFDFANFMDAVHPGSPIFEAANDKLKAHGAMLISAIDIGPPVFVARDPLKTPADFRGKNIRVFSTSTGKLVAALGAAPTQLNQNDVYAALSTGTVQAAIGGLAGIYGAKLYEVTKNVADPGPAWGSLINGYAMNLQRFRSLSPELQKVVMDAAAKANIAANNANASQYAAYLSEMRAKGLNVDRLDMNAFKAVTSTLVDQAKAAYPATDPLVKAVLAAQHKR